MNLRLRSGIQLAVHNMVIHGDVSIDVLVQALTRRGVTSTATAFVTFEDDRYKQLGLSMSKCSNDINIMAERIFYWLINSDAVSYQDPWLRIVEFKLKCDQVAINARTVVDIRVLSRMVKQIQDAAAFQYLTMYNYDVSRDVVKERATEFADIEISILHGKSDRVVMSSKLNELDAFDLEAISYLG